MPALELIIKGRKDLVYNSCGGLSDQHAINFACSLTGNQSEQPAHSSSCSILQLLVKRNCTAVCSLRLASFGMVYLVQGDLAGLCSLH